MSHYESDNFSDHCPVSINLNIQAKYMPLSNGDNKRKALWHLANSGNLRKYKDHLNKLLSQLKLPWLALKCRNVTCKDIVHFKMINELHNVIERCCLDASVLSVPKSKPKRNKSIPGWSEHVKVARKTV